MKYIFLIFSLFFSTFVSATDYTKLMQNNSPYLINLGEEVSVDGSPLIYIEGKKTPRRNPPRLELDNKMTLETPIQQELNFSFKTPFHHPVQAGMIDHISDLVTIVHPIDPETIIVTEDLVQLNTKENKKFVRTITLPTNSSFELILFSQNNTQMIPSQVKMSDSDIVLLSPTDMEIGPNKIHIRYLIRNPFLFDQQKATLNFHLTGHNFLLPINRAQSVILFPQQTQIFTSQLLFGSNKLEVPEAYKVAHDQHGNVTYYLTHLVPAQTDIQTNLTFEKNALPQDTLIELILSSKQILIFILSIILCLYWFASVYWEVHKPLPTYLPAVLKNLSISKILSLFNVGDSLTYFNNILIYNDNIKNNLLLKWLKYRFVKYLYTTYFHLKMFIITMGEICIGSAILIAGTSMISSSFSNSISSKTLLIIASISLIIIVGLYILFLRPYQAKVLSAYARMAMDKEKVPLLTNNQISSLAPLMIATKRQEAWLVLLKKYNPNYLIKNTGGL